MEKFIAILIALIGAFPPLLNWFSDKEKRSRSRRLLEETKARMEFIEGWLRLNKELPEKGVDDHLIATINRELKRLLKRYIELEELDSLRIPQELEGIGLIRRGFLLYLPQSLGQWAVHVSFYIVLVSAIFFLIGLAIPKPGSDPEFLHLLENPMVLVGFIPFGIVIVILQQLAQGMVRRRLEKSLSSKVTATDKVLL